MVQPDLRSLCYGVLMTRQLPFMFFLYSSIDYLQHIGILAELLNFRSFILYDHFFSIFTKGSEWECENIQCTVSTLPVSVANKKVVVCLKAVTTGLSIGRIERPLHRCHHTEGL